MKTNDIDIDRNVRFNTYNNEQRPAFDIISNPEFSMLNGLSIPSGICIYKNKLDERKVGPETLSDTFTNKCIPEGLYNKLFNLACDTLPTKNNLQRSSKSRKTRNFKNSIKKSKLVGSKTSNKNKNKKSNI